MKNYYCLVAGMPDLTMDGSRLSLTIADFKEEYLPQLDPKDQDLMALFFRTYDHRNLLQALRTGALDDFDVRGNFTADEILASVDAVVRDDRSQCVLPEYMYQFVAAYVMHQDQEQLPEDMLAAAFYDEARRSKNKFVREWFQFNLNVNNILVALTARRFDFEARPYLVGEDEVTHALASSGARDFGLGGTVDYMQDLIAISEMTDPVEKEHRLDLLKWNWLEEHTFFHYFSVECIFAFLIKIDIIERWAIIDKERGHQVFRDLLQKLKDEVEVPEEYRI